MSEKSNNRRMFSLNFPAEEAEAVIKAAAEQNVSITMLFRMLVRREIMEDPIRIPEKQ